MTRREREALGRREVDLAVMTEQTIAAHADRGRVAVVPVGLRVADAHHHVARHLRQRIWDTGPGLMSHVAAEGPFREDQQTGPAVARMADQLGDASEADVDVIVERRGGGGDPERSHAPNDPS